MPKKCQWLSHVANPLRMRGGIFQWKVIFDELKSGKQIDLHTLTRLALDYSTVRQWDALSPEEKGELQLDTFVLVQPMSPGTMGGPVVMDPIPTDATLKYPAQRLPPLQILADGAEYLAEEVAELRRVQEGKTAL